MSSYTHKALLLALALSMAACTTTTGTRTQNQATGTGQVRATAAPLPTRVVIPVTNVTADGVMTLARSPVTLGFDVAAKVIDVRVKAGQVVTKGQFLARVDDATLRDALADAQLQSDLVAAQIRQSTIPASKEALDAARAALNAAWASYNVTKAGALAADIEAARVGVESARLSYISSQASRDSACGPDDKSSRCKSAEASYGNAYESYMSAIEAYALIRQPVTQDKLTQAYTSVENAQAKLDSLTAGPTDGQKKINETQLSQSKAALDRARSNLDKAILLSPCDCIVQEVNVVPGSLAGSPAVSLVDNTGLHFETTNVTELDVAKIKVNAPAMIRLRAYDDDITGTVRAVLAETSGSQGGSALYTVLIDLDARGKRLLPGMTGQAKITFS